MTYPVGFLALAVVSTTPQPAQPEELLGAYTLGPPDNAAQNAVWLYSEEPLELDASCTLAGGSDVAEVDLNLAPGWNEAILTLGERARLESASIPQSFVWSEF